MNVWITDRFGVDIDEPTLEKFAELLDSIEHEDENSSEYGSVSVTNADGWNLEFYSDHVLFENVEESDVSSGHMVNLSRDEKLDLAEALLENNLYQLQSLAWRISA